MLLVLLAALAMPGTVAASVDAVGAVGLTVSDLDRSVEFYTGVLTFEQIGETEVSGPEVDRLQGIFGVLIARLRLGDEDIELTEYAFLLAAVRHRWMPVATTAGFSTSRSSCAIWTARTRLCASMAIGPVFGSDSVQGAVESKNGVFR